MDVPSKIRPYRVVFSRDLGVLDNIAKAGDFVCVVDENIARLYSDRIPFLQKLPEDQRLILPIREDFKTISGVERVYDALIRRPAKKNLTIIAIGGGILQDVVGFAASTIYRGIRWVYVPTTLLAQSDSCIGGKTSLNYKRAKNLLGTFYPPFEVIILPQFLTTLTQTDFFSGLGEVVKLHLIGGKARTRWYVDHQKAITDREPLQLMKSIQQSLKIKINYIARDEFDQGVRNMLNFGHCYGHALESASEFAVPHGQAVLVGILFSGIMARFRKLQSRRFQETISNLVSPHLVCPLKKAFFDGTRLLEAMKKDKKRLGNDLSVIVMTDRHRMLRLSDVSPSEFERAHVELAQSLLEPFSRARALTPAEP